MRPKLRLVHGGRDRPRLRRRPWLVGLAIVIVLGIVLALLRKRGGSKPAVERLEEHGGRCAKPEPRESVVPCPYIGMKGPDDYGAPFASASEGECRLAGHLVMPTGELVAADPLVFMNDRAFTISVSPGTYPVFLAQPKSVSGDVALALLRIRESRPTRWEIAKLPNEKPGAHFYPVDAGTGCYVDRAVARRILAREQAAWERHEKDLLQLLNEAGYAHDRSASLCLDPDTGGNIVVFHSGAGDGAYGVYVGHDDTGAVAAFVTDFKLLDLPP